MLNNRCYDTLSLEDIIDEKLFERLGEIKTVADEIRALPEDREYFYGNYKLKNSVFKILNSEIFKHHYNGVVTFKLFKEEFCDYILDRASYFEYLPNTEEPLSAQIPEIVLEQHLPHLYSYLREVYCDIIKDINLIIFGSESRYLRSIQLAKYSSTNTSRGAWHSDMDSDQTMTVVLDNKHTGGGVRIKLFGCTDTIVIRDLPVGTATIFSGKLFLHKGEKVTSGERNLLVFWAELK